MLFKHRLLKTIQIISRDNKDDAVLYFVTGTCLQSSSSRVCRTALPFAIWQVAVSLHWVGCGIFEVACFTRCGLWQWMFIICEAPQGERPSVNAVVHQG